MDLNHFEKQHVKTLYSIGAIVTLLQLLVIISYALVMVVIGPRITSAEEFFTVQQSSVWMSFLRGDFLLMILIGLYLGNFPALMVSLWRLHPITILFAGLFTLMAVIISFAGESTFALMHLGKMYTAAGSELERSQMITAGETILAAGWWNSSGSYMTGILLQGAGVMISVVMLRSPNFSKLTAWAGIIGNSADLLQHLLAPFAPGISEYLSFAMILYLVWYAMLSRDLFRLARQSGLPGTGDTDANVVVKA